MFVIGIDPGAKGAVAAINWGTQRVHFLDMPAIGGWRDFWMEIRHEIHDNMPPRVVCIEKVSSIPGASAKSNFGFGWNVGAINTLIEMTGYPMDTITPKQWQSKVGISISAKLKGAPRKKAIKDAVALKCQQLYPNANIFGPQGGLKDGRSDALMIAHATGLKYFGG